MADLAEGVTVDLSVQIDPTRLMICGIGLNFNCFLDSVIENMATGLIVAKKLGRCLFPLFEFSFIALRASPPYFVCLTESDAVDNAGA